MKLPLLILSRAVLLASCSKTPVTPPVDTPLMTYINLADTAITFNKFASFDLNNDGEKDVLFSTLLVGDPASQQDKKQWYISSSFNANLPVNAGESIPVLTTSDSIPVANFNGYSWYNASSVLLAQKIIGTTGDPFWQGDWKDVTHRFIPVQVKKETGLYNGWIEVSFNTTSEKIILHKAAICKQANKGVQAGK